MVGLTAFFYLYHPKKNLKHNRWHSSRVALLIVLKYLALSESRS